MVFPCPTGTASSAPAVSEILPRLEKMDACLIGCGLGQSEDVRAVVEAVLTHAKCPVVVDADGINVLSGHIDIVRGASCPVVLTPHDGELARLGGDSDRRVLPRRGGCSGCSAQRSCARGTGR